MNKQWRYFFLLLSILAIIIVILLWFAWGKTPEKQDMPAHIVQKSQSYEVEPRKNPSKQRSFRFFDTFAPIVKPFEELIPFADHIKTSLRGSETDEAIPLSSTGLPRSSSTSSDSLAMTDKKTSFTEQEIFNWVWPQDYRRGLAEIETLYINERYIAQRQSTNFNDEKNIYQFLAETLDIAETNGWVNASDAIVLRKGLKETLPRVIEHDKILLRQGLMPISFLPKDIDIAEIRWVIFANIAQASPGWVTGPDCYKDDNPANPIPGPNLWAPCCNCGWFCTPKGCKFFADCGAYSVKCNIPAGCLNFTCRTFPNAIWDPMTGICGCG